MWQQKAAALPGPPARGGPPAQRDAAEIDIDMDSSDDGVAASAPAPQHQHRDAAEIDIDDVGSDMEEEDPMFQKIEINNYDPHALSDARAVAQRPSLSAALAMVPWQVRVVQDPAEIAVSDDETPT